MSSEQEVVCILRECRRLRKSTDKSINNVYFYPDLSPYDARLAFEARKARREGNSGSIRSTQSAIDKNAGRSSANVISHGSTLSHQDFPLLPSTSQSFHPSSFQSTQPSTSQSITNSDSRNTKRLSPSATPFVATTSGVSPTLNFTATAAAPHVINSTCGATDISPDGISDPSSSGIGSN